MSELSGKYPARLHAKGVVEILKKKNPSPSGLIYLEGQKTRLIEDNDEPVPFRQRRFFFYLSGFPLPDASLTYDIDSEKLTLFIPPIDKDEVMWTGLPLTKEEALAKYDADEVLYSNEVEQHLSSAGKSIHALPHNEATFLQSSSTTFKIDTSLLKDAIETARIFKSSYEIAIMKRANEISKIAHESVMAAVSKATNERELEAIFIEKSIANGGRNQAYHSILASGTNAATLHYQKNDQPLKGRLNLLIDAGAEYDCYASDITRTFPISGDFTKESREVYDIVLRMQKECTEMLKGGIKWDDVHYHAHKVAVDGLLKIGILKGDAQEILDKRTSVAFFPHGLGHYLGLNTHDTGGNPNYKDEDSMFRYLRIRGNIPAGSVVTVEPGVYFCEFIIKPYLEDPKHNAHIDEKILKKYWTVGGVRIEDNVLITESGYENLTNVPKEVDDMQRIIKS